MLKILPNSVNQSDQNLFESHCQTEFELFKSCIIKAKNKTLYRFNIEQLNIYYGIWLKISETIKIN